MYLDPLATQAAVKTTLDLEAIAILAKCTQQFSLERLQSIRERGTTHCYHYLEGLSGNIKEFNAYFPLNEENIFRERTGYSLDRIFKTPKLLMHFKNIFNKDYFQTNIEISNNKLSLKNKNLKIIPLELLNCKYIQKLNLSHNHLIFLPWQTPLFKNIKNTQCKR